MNAPFGWDEIRKFFGWEERFLADLVGWEARMVVVRPPADCTFYFDADADGRRDPGEVSKGLRVHPAIADELKACLAEIRATGLWRFVESIGGGYTFRMQRGASKLSMHALGAAVDFDPVRNPFKRLPEETALGTKPGLGVVDIFERRGWTWGGRWDRPDAMHFQFGGGF